jgi:hypothetical protein
MSRLSPQAGIALGPILFMLALLGVIAAVMSASGGGGFNVAGTADRVNADVSNQANLIRSKINECYMQYVTNGVNNSAAPCAGDAYPCSDQTNGSLVSSLTCPGDPLISGAQQSIWTGLRVTLLPQPSTGFTPWFYMNAGDAGGRCIWTSPGSSTATTWTAPANGNNNSGVVEGLKLAAAKFSSQEASYIHASTSQKFVVFITRPTGTTDSHCSVP